MSVRLEALKCKECGERTRSRLASSATSASAPSRWPTTSRASTPPRSSAGSRAARRTSGATRTSCRSSSAPQTALAAGVTPLVRADRLAERLGLREVWVKNDAANPTHSFKDRVVTVALAKARELGFQVVACASTGNLANSVAAHAAAAGLESYVFIPSDLEEQKVLATGVYGTKLVAVRGNYDDVNRLCTELSGERDWAFVNVNLRPYYAEGSKTLALRDRRAARLRAARPDRRAGRLRVAVHEDRPRLRGVARGRPARGRAAEVQRRPGHGLLAGRPGVRGGPRASAGRCARRRSPSRSRSATRPTARTRWTWRGAPAAAIDCGVRRRDPRGHPPAGRDHRHLHGDRRRRHDRDAGQARPARAGSAPTSGS